MFVSTFFFVSFFIAATALDFVPVFTPGELGYPCIRIPSLLLVDDEKLLAIAEVYFFQCPKLTTVQELDWGWVPPHQQASTPKQEPRSLHEDFSRWRAHVEPIAGSLSRCLRGEPLEEALKTEPSNHRCVCTFYQFTNSQRPCGIV